MPDKKETDDTPAILQLLAPDGYYNYLGVNKESSSSPEKTSAVEISEDLIKKNYRRLSLRHHPDRPTGDAETFRVLNRAQKVLSNTKLRQQYDLLGLDLDDEEERTENDDDAEDGEERAEDTVPETVLSTMASMTLAVLLQVILRTVMMALVSVLVTRYRLLLFPALGFLCFVAYRVYTMAVQAGVGVSQADMASPILIGIGLFFMYRARSSGNFWNWTFWIGEALVLTMFIHNSLTVTKTPLITGIVGFFALLLTLWLRGNPWTYATVIGLEAVVLALTSLAFPIMDMILEQIMNEKLRKIGEKVRAHAKRMEDYYGNKKR